MKKRALKLAVYTLILLGIGVFYTVFYRLTGWGLPCVFNKITGLKCPGCGVSRMCLSFMRLDFVSAFRYNRALFCLIPLMAATAARLIYVYIRYDRRKDRFAEISFRFMIAVMVIFGIVRNFLKI